MNKQENRPLVLFQCATGNIMDIPEVDSYDPPDLLHVFWLDVQHIAFTFSGRSNFDWTIYEISSGKKRGGGCSLSMLELERFGFHFYLVNGHVFTNDDYAGDEWKVFQLWSEGSKEK